MNGWMDEEMMDRWMEGWVDGWIGKGVDGYPEIVIVLQSHYPLRFTYMCLLFSVLRSLWHFHASV